jgi:hypothetical protein
MLGDDPTGFCLDQRADLLTFSNARQDCLSRLPPFKGMHLVRDPRDILVSSYFSHRNSHPTDKWPELSTHRANLLKLPLEQGLLQEMECRARQFSDMFNWHYQRPEILELRMEDLTEEPEQLMIRLFAFWGRLAPDRADALRTIRELYNKATIWLEYHRSPGGGVPRWRMNSVSPAMIRKVTAQHAFVRKSGGRNRGQLNTQHHYRNGMAGDWKKYFSPELTRCFKHRYNDLLVKLGYEQDAAW